MLAFFNIYAKLVHPSFVTMGSVFDCCQILLLYPNITGYNGR